MKLKKLRILKLSKICLINNLENNIEHIKDKLSELLTYSYSMQIYFLEGNRKPENLILEIALKYKDNINNLINDQHDYGIIMIFPIEEATTYLNFLVLFKKIIK
jgi:hypothetical protein